MLKALFAPLALMPPVVRRLYWWMVLPALFAIGYPVIMRVPAVLDAIATLNHWVIVAIPAVVLLPIFVAFLGVWRGTRRIKRAVAAASGRACLNCIYDLSGLADTGACPECGRAFDTTADQRSWARVKMFK